MYVCESVYGIDCAVRDLNGSCGMGGDGERQRRMETNFQHWGGGAGFSDEYFLNLKNGCSDISLMKALSLTGCSQIPSLLCVSVSVIGD